MPNVKKVRLSFDQKCKWASVEVEMSDGLIIYPVQMMSVDRLSAHAMEKIMNVVKEELELRGGK